MPVIEVKVPDIGDFTDVPVVEILVSPGDQVQPEEPLISLESDKATMDVPAPQAGRIVELSVSVGDRVSMGSTVLKLDSECGAVVPNPEKAGESQDTSKAETTSVFEPLSQQNSSGSNAKTGLPTVSDFSDVHASPSVRMIARELGVDLKKINGTGAKGRVTKDDVKQALQNISDCSSNRGGMGIQPIPSQDFAKFGPIEEKSLSRLKKLSGPHLHRAWLNVPHVTHCDDADITELDEYRRLLDGKAKADGYRVTLLAFILKASVTCLKEFPEFNSSLGPNSDTLIYKHYYNIGIAVDTPDGLVVPVIKDVDRKGIIELSKEMAEISIRMRDGKITPADIQGATFSISSLGGIGGTYFTPIVNAPEVAILGVVRTAVKPIWDGETFKPRSMLPLCVSYDHRVIDGALAARFTRRMCDILGDLRQMLL
ncbi:MAG: Dihydrolipoyllysine-residue acetyltransferase component of pyruvate dehydrogenase complex [Hyphomicrobiaceae bacterium hypho_1]